MPVIAGLDVATRSGIAVFDGGKLIHASSHRPAGKESAEILHGFRVWLRPLLLSHGVEAVAIEKPIPPSGFGRKKRVVVKDRGLWGGQDTEIVADESPTNFETILRLHELFGHADEIAFSLNIDRYHVAVSTWRAAFGINQRPGPDVKDVSRWRKQLAIAQCQRLGWAITAPDAADAVGVAFWLAGALKINQRQAEMAL